MNRRAKTLVPTSVSIAAHHTTVLTSTLLILSPDCCIYKGCCSHTVQRSYHLSSLFFLLLSIHKTMCILWTALIPVAPESTEVTTIQHEWNFHSALEVSCLYKAQVRTVFFLEFCFTGHSSATLLFAPVIVFPLYSNIQQSLLVFSCLPSPSLITALWDFIGGWYQGRFSYLYKLSFMLFQ